MVRRKSTSKGANPSPKERLQSLPFSRIIPNMTTLVALCTGLSAIRFAMNGQYEYSVLAILAAAILDTLDGRLARMLGSASKFGAELDSLSDFVCFGVSPGIVLYIVSLQEWDRFGWALVLFFALCMGFRLARFNVASDDKQRPEWAKHFFIGVPAPAGALLVTLGMDLTFATDLQLFNHPVVHAVLLIIVGLLLISRVPTFSGKGYKVPHNLILPMMLVFAIGIAALITAPWYTLTVVGLLYLGSMPFSYRAYHRALKIS